jgi:hypothetical protein
MKITFEFPKVSRTRAIFTGTACTALSTVWISAPWSVGQLPLIPQGSTSPMLVLVGLLGPAGFGLMSLLAAEYWIRKGLAPGDTRPRSCPGAAAHAYPDVPRRGLRPAELPARGHQRRSGVAMIRAFLARRAVEAQFHADLRTEYAALLLRVERQRRAWYAGTGAQPLFRPLPGEIR